jgi:hypothetical protein
MGRRARPRDDAFAVDRTDSEDPTAHLVPSVLVVGFDGSPASDRSLERAVTLVGNLGRARLEIGR